MSDNKELLQSILDACTMGMAVYKAVRNDAGQITDFIHEFINKKTLETLGRDLTGKLLSEHDNVRIQQIELFKQVIESKEENEYTLKIGSGGVAGWFHFSNVPLGKDRLLHTWKDITAQKEEELQHIRLKEEIAQTATDKYYSIFNSIDEGFCIYELIYENEKVVDLCWVEVNAAYEKQTGLKDVIGKRHSDLGLATESYWFELFDKVAKTGESIHFEDWHEPTKRWYDTRSSRIGSANNNQVAVLFSEVTQRKQHEQQQEYLLKLSDAIRTLSAPAEIEGIACKLIGEELRSDRAFYLEIREAEGHVNIKQDHFRVNSPSIAGIHAISAFAWAMPLCRKGEPVAIANIYDTDLMPKADLPAIEALQIVSYCILPLVKNDVLLGALAVTEAVPREWKPHEIALLSETAERIWAAVERAKTEEALKRNEQKFSSLFESIDEGFCIIELVSDADGKLKDLVFVQQNSAFNKQSGLGNVVGSTVYQILPHFEQYWMHMLSIVATTGEPKRIENYVQDVDRWFNVYFSLIGEIGSKFIAVVFNNVTERKHREQQHEYLLKLSDILRSTAHLQEIQERAAHALGTELGVTRAFYCAIEREDGEYIYILSKDYYNRPHMPDLKGRHRQADHHNSFFTGLERGEVLVIKDATQLSHLAPDMLALYIALGMNAIIAVPLIKNGAYVAAFAVTDNKPRNWTAHELTLVQETAERTWAAVERARAEDALREREQQLKRLLKLRDEFIGVASHELNTPITSMKVYAEIVQERMESSGDPDDIDLLAKLNVQIDRLSLLITTLLDTTRIAEGKLQLNLEAIDMNGIIRERAEEISRTSDHKIELQMQNVPTVVVDRERIGQVMTNLLSNAIKYSPKGTTITVTTIAEANRIKVSVQDRGYGIPENDIPKIFDRFFRVTANKMDTYPGMGLGLYISAQIIERHGGNIFVKSKLGAGSTFSFTLPLQNSTQ